MLTSWQVVTDKSMYRETSWFEVTKTTFYWKTRVWVCCFCWDEQQVVWVWCFGTSRCVCLAVNLSAREWEPARFPMLAGVPCPGGVLVSVVWKWWIWARANVAAFRQVVRVWCVGELPLFQPLLFENSSSGTKCNQILEGVHTKSKWLIKVSAVGTLSWSSSPPRWDVRRRGVCSSGKGEQWGLSSAHVELYSLTAMTIRHSLADNGIQTATQKQTATNSLLSPSLCCCIAFVFFPFCSLNPHYISFHSPSTCHLSLLLTAPKAENCTRQVVFRAAAATQSLLCL